MADTAFPRYLAGRKLGLDFLISLYGDHHVDCKYHNYRLYSAGKAHRHKLALEKPRRLFIYAFRYTLCYVGQRAVSNIPDSNLPEIANSIKPLPNHPKPAQNTINWLETSVGLDWLSFKSNDQGGAFELCMERLGREVQGYKWG